MTCVVVTGGSAGIGLQIARRLGQGGAEIVMVARDQARLGEAADVLTSEGISCRAAALDVRDGDAVNDLIESLPGVDGVVNNAAGNFVSPAVEMSAKGFRAVVEISLYGTFNFSTAVARRLMTEGRHGSICNIIATYAWTGAPGVSHSAAAKAGVLAFTKSVAREWGAQGIRVNAVAPGFVPTQNATANILSDPDASEHMRKLIPLGRFGHVDEIADAVDYLMSDRAAYVTGAVLTVDGGRSLGISMHAAGAQAHG